MKIATPMDLWLTGLQTTQMMVEAQGVIAMRLMGMAGLWSVAPSESTRMFTEKPAAFLLSASAATAAAMAGQRPDQVLAAAVRPIRVKTRANSRRLSKRGFKV